MKLDDKNLQELLKVVKLSNLEGLRRLEMLAVSQDDLAGEAGLALLDECEKRSISVLSGSGYMWDSGHGGGGTISLRDN
ncbi:hypothetical protein RQP46_010294 [Phenoliferia psychrophenolica]